MSDYCDPMEPARLLCPWDSPGKSTGVGCHSLLQGIFPTQELNPGLLQCMQILFRLSYEGIPGGEVDDFNWKTTVFVAELFSPSILYISFSLPVVLAFFKNLVQPLFYYCFFP